MGPDRSGLLLGGWRVLDGVGGKWRAARRGGEANGFIALAKPSFGRTNLRIVFMEPDQEGVGRDHLR